MARANLLKG